MVYSDEFIRLIRKSADDEQVKVSIARSLLFDFLSDVPKELKWDIFNIFHPDLEEDSSISLNDAERFALVINLFEGEYEDDKLALTDDELKHISDGVNDFAGEVSEDGLMNVMKAAVSRGLIR